MNTMQITIFCLITLALSLVVAALIYPYAKLPDSVSSANSAPRPMEEFNHVIDMGEEYGSMSVIELMGYYLDNPPAPVAVGVPVEPKRHFGGC